MLVDTSIHQFGIFDKEYPPNQVLVNRYQKRDRLGLHVENVLAFGDVIAGVSLGSTDFLRLMSDDEKKEEYFLELEDCSCYVLTGEARFKWRHGIARTMDRVAYKEQGF